MNLRSSLLLVTLILLCFALPAHGTAPTGSLSYGAADTAGEPPRDAASFISQAKAAVAQENWTQALVITTRGIAWYPDDPELLCLQGYSYRKSGQYQKAVDSVSRAIPFDPRAVRYANRGYAYLALGNYTAALADAESGIAKDSSYTANHGVRALALHAMGRDTEALASIETAISQSPDSAHYWHVKGKILAAGRDCAGATAAFEKSITLDPGYTLPYPSFGTARENLAELQAGCKSTPVPVPSTPAKSPAGPGVVVAVAIAALAVAGMRK